MNAPLSSGISWKPVNHPWNILPKSIPGSDENFNALRLIGLGEKHPAATGLSTKDAVTSSALFTVEGNHPNGDGEGLPDLVFAFRVITPVRESESAVDLRSFRILGGKKVPEILPTIYLTGILVSER